MQVLELVLALLQVLGVLLAGLFGLLGLLKKYRDDTGSITRWGRVALVAIIVSMLVAVSSQTLETIRKRDESRVAAQRTERIIGEMARAIHPLTNVELAAWILMPWDHAQLGAYRARVAPVFRRIRAEWTGSGFDQVPTCRRLLCIGGYRPSWDMHIMPPEEFAKLMAKEPGAFGTEAISFDSRSPLFPREGVDGLARHLTRSQVQLAIYKHHINPDRFSAMWSLDDRVDLRFSVQPEDRERELTYELVHDRLVLFLSGRADPRFWDTTGTIVALPDLLGAQMLISVVPGSMAQEEIAMLSRRSRLSAARYGLELGDVSMHLGGRHILLSRNSELKPHTSADGFALWSYTFPSSLEELGNQSSVKGQR